jgi:hypothetical protein
MAKKKANDLSRLRAELREARDAVDLAHGQASEALRLECEARRRYGDVRARWLLAQPARVRAREQVLAEKLRQLHGEA